MKVIFDVESIHGKLTGIGRYSYELASRISSLGAEDVMYWNGVSFQAGLYRSIPGERKEGGAVKRVSSSDYFKNLSRRLIYSRLAGLGAKFVPTMIKRKLSASLRSFYSDEEIKSLKDFPGFIFHGPNFFLPDHPGKKVVTVHDLSVFRYPQYHPDERVKFMLKAVPDALDRADAIISISKFTKSELLQFFPDVAKKIHVVPNGVNKPIDVDFNDSDEKLLSQLRLRRGGFLLCVSTVEPRKNLALLLDAYLGLSREIRSDFPLVLVGGEGWKSKDLMNRIRRLESENVQYLGYAEQSVVDSLYKSARAFVFPSLYEGFGLPAIEAMSFGLPVICARDTSVSEVCGGNALEFSGGSISELSHALIRIIDDEEFVAKLKKASLEQADKYSWEQCCRETLAVYKKVMAD